MPFTGSAPARAGTWRHWFPVVLVVALAVVMSSCGGCGSGKQAGPPSAGRASPSATVGQQPPKAPRPPDPSELLASDLARGALTLDQETRYRVLRHFRPSAVPARYRLDRAPQSGTWDVLQAVRRRRLLSPETVRELDPYVVPPTDPRSIFFRRLGLEAPSPLSRALSLEATLHAAAVPPYTTDTGFTIKFIGEPAVAAVVAKARALVEQHKIYERLAELLGRETLHPGNRTLVIVIAARLAEYENEEGLRFSPRGICYAVTSERYEEDTASAVIGINAEATAADPKLAATITHEMFHAFQFAFSTAEEKWLDEGTAEWAKDFIGPEWNVEQERLGIATFNDETSSHNRLAETVSDTAYGMYLFFYYLTRIRPGAEPRVMRDIWETCGRAKGASLASVKSSVAGEFADVFNDYGFRTLDEGDAKGSFPDTVGSYGGADPLPLAAVHGYRGLWHIDEEGRPNRRSALAVKPLAVSYVQITNASQGPAAPTVRVDLTEFQGKRDAAIHAVILYSDGRSETEDWSDLDKRVFCLALDSQNFSSIYLSVSNAQEGGPERPFVLDLGPDPDVECAAAQMRVTVAETGEEGVQYAKRWGGTTKDSIKIWRWRQEWSVGLDLVPTRRNTAADAGRVLGWLPGGARDAARGPLLQPLEGEDDEATGCRVYTYRVSAVRPIGFERTSSLTSTEANNDAHGLSYYRKLKDEERWVSQGIASETRKWLSDESLKVRVYVDPDSRRIRWVSPQGPFSIAATGTRSLKQEGRQRLPPWPYDTYEDIGRSDSRTLSGTMSVRHVSADDKALPLNPDWMARHGSATSAQGEGRVNRPLDREKRTDEGEVTTTKGTVTQSVKWSLRLAQAIK